MNQKQPTNTIFVNNDQLSKNNNPRSFSNKVKLWIKELRAPFLTASIIPVFLGTVVAFHVEDTFNFSFFILTMVAMILLHSGTNVLNDYYDYMDGVDKIDIESTPFSGGSGLLADGSLRPKSVFNYAMSLLLVGCIIGVYIAYERGLIILIFGIMGLISGIFYSAHPVKLINRGVGELFVGINFGPLVVIGSYYVQTQSLAIEPVVASLPMGFLITAVLYINEFPDYSTDKDAWRTNI